jgi:RIO kinase 1
MRSFSPVEWKTREKEEVPYVNQPSTVRNHEPIDCSQTHEEQRYTMSKRKQLRALDEAEEQELAAQRDPIEEALETFIAEGIIGQILYPVMRGKEATVYCCQAHPSTGAGLLAAKIYRPREHRGFQNDAIYQEGRFVANGQVRRALQKKSRFGRQVQFSLWVDHEFAVLRTLHHAGADTPRPIARTEHAILMEYFGDRDHAAPSLGATDLTREQARTVFDRLMWNVELWLAHNHIHGDLSAYNVLFWHDQAKIIDFPQAVDPRFNPNAHFLLTRDIERICQHVAGYGLEYDAGRIAERLWHRFTNAQL